VIALGIYFCLADFTLIAQCLYYNHINSTRGRQASTTSATSNTLDENSPLLSRERTNSSIGLPGSHRRRRTTSSASAGSGEGARDVLGKILDDEFGPQGSAATWRYNALCILGVCVAGAVGWVCAWRAGVWTPTPEPGPERAAQGDEMDMAVGAQVLGYFSALCYLGARIPQIVKNWREKSCEGSFFFSLPPVQRDAPAGPLSDPFPSLPFAASKYLCRFLTLAISDEAENRPRTPLLPPLPPRERHLRRRHSVSLPGQAVPPQELTLADWQSGHHGGGWAYFLAV
jgi:hypothetical protein